jgi:hypothetical protein
MKPLQRGAFEAMVARYPKVDQDKLREWFSVSCRQKSYVNKIANRKPRHDLDGKFVAGVSDQDVADAKLRIQLTAVYASRGLVPQSERRHFIVETKRKRIVRVAA